MRYDPDRDREARDYSRDTGRQEDFSEGWDACMRNVENIVGEFYDSVIAKTGGPLPWKELQDVKNLLDR